MNTAENTGWATVASRNRSYRAGALAAQEGQRIKWHSPSEERSSQVFCISAFGCLRSLPDRDELVGQLLSDILGPAERGGPWRLTPEYCNPDLLGETGQGTPTMVDFFCEGPRACVCIESKFLYDAAEGFGTCGQVRKGNCRGYHGSGSDRKTGKPAACRLAEAEGRRKARLYWDVALPYFQTAVFAEQTPDQSCPFAGPHFQLMRNTLLAAKSAGPCRAFGVVCMVPAATAQACRDQVRSFATGVLSDGYRARIAVVTYDAFVALLLRSPHAASQELGLFLEERMTALL